MNKNIKTGLQLYSLRDSASKDPAAVLAAVKEMGYDGAELAGLYGYSAEKIKSFADGAGLCLISAHVPFADLVANTEKEIENALTLGLEYVAVPYMTEEYRPTFPRFFEAVDAIRSLGEKFKAAGITLLYHNHDFEFKKVDGVYGLDYIYSHVSPELLKTEIDTCWVNVAGEDPSAYVRKYAGRCPLVHLKDFYMPKGSVKEGHRLYSLIGMKDEKEECSSFEFRPCGHGMQDMASVIAASVESGAEWLVVEQDQPSPSLGKDPAECAKMSIDFVNGVLRGM